MSSLLQQNNERGLTTDFSTRNIDRGDNDCLLKSIGLITLLLVLNAFDNYL